MSPSNLCWYNGPLMTFIADVIQPPPPNMYILYLAMVHVVSLLCVCLHAAGLGWLYLPVTLQTLHVRDITTGHCQQLCLFLLHIPTCCLPPGGLALRCVCVCTYVYVGVGYMCVGVWGSGTDKYIALNLLY